MATWRKALVLGLAVLVGALPVLARVDASLGSDVTALSCEDCLLLPVGEEIDDELVHFDGEVAWYPVALLDAGIGGGAAVGIAILGGDQLTPGQMAGIGAIGAGAGLVIAILHHVLGVDKDGGK